VGNLQTVSKSQLRAALSARNYLAARRRREELLGTGLFADPAWDMLLDLYAGQIEGKEVSVSSACMAGAVPSTTALGWVVKLEKRGLLERTPDRTDGRRTFLRLTPSATAAVEQWLEETFSSE
jgi:hypothetical protein